MEPAYPLLKVLQQGNQVAVQPASTNGNEPLETLSIDLATGSIAVLSKPPLRASGTSSAFAVLGLSKLHKGYALAIATEASKAGTLSGAEIYQLQGAQLLHPPAPLGTSRENKALLTLLADALNPQGTGRNLFFSHFYDLTRSAQALADAAVATSGKAASSVPGKATTGLMPNPDFWWNRMSSLPLLQAGAGRFCPPVILGFVGQLPGLHLQGGDATMTLIARRGVLRAGTRQWRRGANRDGHVANYVETEQQLSLDATAGTETPTIASHVVVRGSIPLLWTQLPNIKYKPTTVIAGLGESSAPFDKHFGGLISTYKDVVAVNLIDHGKGTEGRLEAAFRAEAERYVQTHPNLRYLGFDFHHETKGQKYHRVNLLWDKVEEDFERHGFFLLKDGQVEQRQDGVFRINCIDCLDRTNVVQGVLGRKALESMMQRLQLLGEDAHLADTYPTMEREFRILWADHGDAVSTQYAGTGAMKSGFTRTGKRTIGGVVDDGVKAVVRYYLNNFQDGRKQDAVDLFTGAYIPSDNRPLPLLKLQPSPFIPIALALIAIVIGSLNLGSFLGAAGSATANVVTSGHASEVVGAVKEASEAAMTYGGKTGGDGGSFQAILRGVLVPLAFGFGVLGLVIQNGKHLVAKPRLCPEAATTVVAPAQIIKNSPISKID